MRLRVFSDLHLEFQNWLPPDLTADVVILAGDIHVGVAGVHWAREHFGSAEIVYVAGNHEYFGADWRSTRQALRDVARQHAVHFLDGDRVDIAGVRFLGATLWTDFALYGQKPLQIARAMSVAGRVMTDYRLVRHGSRQLTPADTRDEHLAQVAWLRASLVERHQGPTVVVTHHLPHERSVHARFGGDVLNPSFASDLDDLVRAPVSLWVHGHTHESFDYEVNRTRVLCNPRGYLPQDPNRRFDAAAVLELS
jgi:predicted phosphodiesterase